MSTGVVPIEERISGTEPQELRDIGGPSALGGGWGRMAELLWLSARNAIRLDYRGSVLGFAWTLIRPLALFGILYLVFSRVVKFGDEVENYAVVLLLGIVLFSFVQEATTGALGSLVAGEGTVRRTQFPRIVLPLTSVASAGFALLMNLLAVVVFIAIAGVEPRLTWLLFPVLLFLLLLLSIGLALGLSAIYVLFRDTRQAWSVLIRALFYATPILYPVELVLEAGLKVLVLVNPVAPIVVQARVWLVDSGAPDAAEAAGGGVWLLIPAAIGAAILVFGALAFSRIAPRVAEEL